MLETIDESMQRDEPLDMRMDSAADTGTIHVLYSEPLMQVPKRLGTQARITPRAMYNYCFSKTEAPLTGWPRRSVPLMVAVIVLPSFVVTARTTLSSLPPFLYLVTRV